MTRIPFHNIANSKKRLSQSPKNKSKSTTQKQPLQTITVFDKENLPNGFAPVPADPVITIPTDDTTNFTTDFSKFDSESRYALIILCRVCLSIHLQKEEKTRVIGRTTCKFQYPSGCATLLQV